MTRIAFAFVLMSYFGWVSPARAGWGTTTGKEPWLWEQHNLIIARITAVRALDQKKDENETATHVLGIVPLLTVAGHLDPSEKSELQVRLAVSRISSSVSAIPNVGSVVLVLIVPGNIGGDEERPFIWVTPNYCDFMPGGAALVALNDFNDKRIFETLRKVRDGRATNGATRPSSGPSSK